MTTPKPATHPDRCKSCGSMTHGMELCDDCGVLPTPEEMWGDRDLDYMPVGSRQALGYFIEECGEALAAAGKTVRWGPDSVNPTLPPEQQEENRDWLMREIEDLKVAIAFLEKFEL